MDVKQFAQRIQAIHGRLSELYQDVDSSAQTSSDLLLPAAFKELATTSEELQVAVEELSRQNEELADIQAQLEAERQRYKELFERVPNAYWVTDTTGKILEANRAMATLLNIEQPFLRDKLLINFIPLAERPAFRLKLNQLQRHNGHKKWTIRLQPRNGECFEATVSVELAYDSQGNSIYLRWLASNILQGQPTAQAQSVYNPNLYQNRPLHTYSKGEIIPLSSTNIWLVTQGLVKLTTMSETGNEVLIGLAGLSMPFGVSMTSLPTYQATAFSETVELVSFSLSEINNSPQLIQAIFPQVNQRLRQTEQLLAVSGKRQVKDRLLHLLMLLKQELGEPIPQGIRLRVRFTHQELADACCTTRVTVTRLLGQLQKQKKIAFDSNHHLILVGKEWM
jgi:PAS domain S-box-containing protein